jgi:hypothetical protein
MNYLLVVNIDESTKKMNCTGLIEIGSNLYFDTYYQLLQAWNDRFKLSAFDVEGYFDEKIGAGKNVEFEYFLEPIDGSQSLLINVNSIQAIDVITDTTNFSNNFSENEVNLQQCLDIIDKLRAGSLPNGLENQILRHNDTNWEVANKVELSNDGALSLGGIDSFNNPKILLNPGDFNYPYLLINSREVQGNGYNDILIQSGVSSAALRIVKYYNEGNLIQAEGIDNKHFLVEQTGLIKSSVLESTVKEDLITDDTEDGSIIKEIRNIATTYYNSTTGNEVYEHSSSIGLNKSIYFDRNSIYLFELCFYAKHGTGDNPKEFKFMLSTVSNIIILESVNISIFQGNSIDNYECQDIFLKSIVLPIDTSYSFYKVSGLIITDNQISNQPRISTFNLFTSNSNTVILRNWAYFKAVKQTQ